MKTAICLFSAVMVAATLSLSACASQVGEPTEEGSGEPSGDGGGGGNGDVTSIPEVHTMPAYIQSATMDLSKCPFAKLHAPVCNPTTGVCRCYIP